MNKAKSLRSKIKPIQQSVKDWVVSLDIPNESTKFATEIDGGLLI
jgi:hypothetical protein